MDPLPLSFTMIARSYRACGAGGAGPPASLPDPLGCFAGSRPLPAPRRNRRGAQEPRGTAGRVRRGQAAARAPALPHCGPARARATSLPHAPPGSPIAGPRGRWGRPARAAGRAAASAHAPWALRRLSPPSRPAPRLPTPGSPIAASSPRGARSGRSNSRCNSNCSQHMQLQMQQP